MKRLIEPVLSRAHQQALAHRVRREEGGAVRRPADACFDMCPRCGRRAQKEAWNRNLCVCPFCGAHRPIGGYCRLSMILDSGTFVELNRNKTGQDVLRFPGYRDKLEAQKHETGLEEAVVTATGKIGGVSVVAAVLDGRFLMGSMGTGVGEKVTLAVEYARERRLPLIIFSASGGARMQEGIYSLMQMAKTSAALERYAQEGGLYISYLTHPTTGGVTASFASLGDITLAEPGALIGFAGPRVIEQTIGERLPEGFQRSEYLEQHGFVDQVVPRSRMRATLEHILKLHGNGVRPA